ncbi:MAG: peptide-methionine (S)-S-oxide reductase MsrA [Verrucomicrobiales bacterium]
MKSAKLFCTSSFVLAMITTLTGCYGEEEKTSVTKGTIELKSDTDKTAANAKLETITLGAGCFWCTEAILERVKGVDTVESGYSNGDVENPTYKQVCTGRTGHAEVVQVKFDPKVLPLEKLLDIFFDLHDPTTLNRQGADRGTQYRSGIYYSTEEQKKVAIEVTKRWNESGHYKDPIVTEIVKAGTFYPAEDYHQDFFKNQPNYGYCQVVIMPKLKKLGLLKDGK